MLKELGFYNHFGNGDVFESREFVREIMNLFPAERYTYYNSRSPRLLLDIPEITVINKIPTYLNGMRATVEQDNSLFINTWIGRDSRYVFPGYACTVEKLHEMYNDILKKYGKKLHFDNPLHYLTAVDYQNFDCDSIVEFVETHLESNNGIYISNGFVNSNQAKNFDMTPLIFELAGRNKDRLFFITMDVPDKPKNVIDANSLVSPYLDSNLMELSYLSIFCNTIIGRNSGPHVVTWTAHTCFLPPPTKNITLTYDVNCSHFVHHLPIIMEKYWSNKTDTSQLADWIDGVING